MALPFSLRARLSTLPCSTFTQSLRSNTPRRGIQLKTSKFRPLTFHTKGFEAVDACEKVEEETLPMYKAERYYPAQIGQIFKDRYQVVGKVGYGGGSTAWLSRDLE